MSNPSEAVTTVMFVDVDELIKKAWSAVDKAGVPEPIQGVALKEAIDFLRDGSSPPGAADGSPGRSRKRGGSKGGSKPQKTRPAPLADNPADAIVEESEFFSNLASESGVEEKRLRDCLQLTKAGTVHVTPPTRELGDSVRAQALIVIALVAGARSRGLGENPVLAEEVRTEVKRKHCFDSANFSKHLGVMRGFNAGSKRTEIVATSKWVDEFKSAVDTALGGGSDADSGS